MTVTTITLIAACEATAIVALLVMLVSSRSRNRVLLDMERRQGEKSLEAEKEKTAELKAAYDKNIGELKANQEKALNELRDDNERAVQAARTALELENEKNLKAREESLKKEAAETMKALTGGLGQNIREMKEAFEAQKKSHTEESSSIKTQFEQTVRHIREQTEAIGTKAESLASALKGQNKMQGIFGETILANMLRDEGFREGHDYDSEFWLRDRNGNMIKNEDTGKRMRPDFVLHFPDDTDVIIDAKVSLSALADYFEADSDEKRADASKRNLESVKNHIKELTSKEYHRYIESRKTLDYVIMFIPNYGAYQLAKQEDRDIFSKAFKQNVLITTEETLIPFLRLIRSAWVRKEQMDNIQEIVKAAEDMVERVGLFCQQNAEIKSDLDKVIAKFNTNSHRLVDSKQSIVRAAQRAVDHGVAAPTGKNALPELMPFSE